MMSAAKIKMVSLIVGAATLAIAGSSAVLLPSLMAQVGNGNAPGTAPSGPTGGATTNPNQPPVVGRFPTTNAMITAAKTDIANLATALDAFEIDNGRYPTTGEGLIALIDPPTAPMRTWHGPYVRAVPRDPWGQVYIYRYPGTHNRSGFDLYSSGPDGKPDSADDIGNWKP